MDVMMLVAGAAIFYAGVFVGHFLIERDDN